MRHASLPAFHLEVREGMAMARYFAFLVVGCAFTFCAAAMAKTHLQVSNPAPQFAAYQSAQ
jgi:hypothetical protein